MTARRRRKTGSGPSATALIAWVGGRQVVAGASSGVHAWSSGRSPAGRAILVGRACGLAAGTVLACGSLLAGAVNVGEGSLTRESAPLPSYTPVGPDAGSSPDGYGGQAPADHAVAAPDAVSTQALAPTDSALRQRSGRVHRNKPVSFAMPAEHSSPPPTAQRSWGSSPPAAAQAPTGPIAPVKPVLDPAASGVARVGEVFASENSRDGQPRASTLPGPSLLAT
jgi:hypothetical protein